LTTWSRPDLYALLSASCTLFAITLFRRCSHPLSSSSYVRCIVPTPSQASAMPRLKCFISLFGLVARLFPSLYILCVLLAFLPHCYRNFPVSCPHSTRDWWSTTVSFVTPSSLLFSFIPSDCIQSRLLPLGMKRFMVVLLGFLASLRVSLSNLPYTTNNHLAKVFQTHCGLDSVEMYDIRHQRVLRLSSSTNATD